MNALLDAALAYGARGWHVVPLHSMVGGRCTCSTSGALCDAKNPAPGKHPRTRDGLKSASPDADQIRTWWERWPDSNIGVVTAPSGLTVLDVDVKDGAGGMETLATIDAELTPTLMARTGSGGLHAVYARPEGVEPRNRIRFMPGLDLIGRGYFIAAPSNHASGGDYSWIDDAPVAPLPPCLRTVAGEAKGPVERVSSERQAYGPASPELLERARQRLLEHGPSIKGQGGDQHAYRVGCILLHDLALSWEEAIPLAVWWNVHFPENRWSLTRLEEKLKNGAQYADGRYGEAREVFEARGSFPGTTDPESDSMTFISPGAPILQDPPPQTAGEFYAADLGSFLGQDDPDDSADNWIVHGVLAASVPQVIGGPPKSHKTFIAEHLLITVAAGLECWLGHKPLAVKQSNVLMLLREDSFRESRRRIWRLCRGLGLDPRSLEGRMWVDCITPFYFSSDQDVLRLGRTIKERNIGVVAIDSLSRTHQGDENSVKEMSIVTSRWNEICQATGVALPVIHHFNKWGEGPLLQRLRGTSDIGAMVRHIMGVAKDPQGTSSIEFDGNLHPLLDPFSIRIDDGTDEQGKKTITLTHDGDAREKQNAVMDSQILHVLEQSVPQGLTASGLQKLLKGNNEFKMYRRDVLIKQGKIMVCGKNYRISVMSAPIDPDAPATAFLKGM